MDPSNTHRITHRLIDIGFYLKIGLPVMGLGTRRKMTASHSDEAARSFHRCAFGISLNA